MRPLTLRQLAHVLNGRLEGESTTVVTAVSTDSRAVGPNTLFFALKGDRFDGHDFVGDVLARGAIPVVSRPLPTGARGLVVSDTQRALEDLGRVLRNLHPARVIGVTGSVGKTTVKDMIAAALADFGDTGKTIGNYNNHIGLPLTLAATRGTERFLVLELGMSAPGEIARLSHIARPDVAVVTCAAAAHLAFFPDVDAIADAKAELYEHRAPAARAVVNADDARMTQRGLGFAADAITFGLTEGADVRVVEARHEGRGLSVLLNVQGKPLAFTLGALGLHQAQNAACTIATCLALGLDLEIAARSLSRHFTPPKHRLQPLAFGPLTVLDDCYNASPTSMKAALLTLDELARGGRRGAILGSMRELGETADALHAEVGRLCRGLDFVACTGTHAEALASGAIDVGVTAVWTAPDVLALEGPIRAFAREATHLLVKGSRGERLERILSIFESLENQGTRSGEDG
jgi:UDP-N-acetylmuramoyl-tripeptide--D-alanyl-D-alanine ligase